MYYQIHAGSTEDMRGDNDDGNVKAIVILGGYIYPAGQNIYHDPMFQASSIMLSIDPGFQPLVLLLVIGAVGACISSIGAVTILRRRTKRLDERFAFQEPPPYRKK